MKTPSSFMKLVVAIIFIICASQAKAQCLSSWKYYLPIAVTNQTSTALSAYQVKITVNTASIVSGGKMISTGDDIRFCDSASCQPLPYWIESGINTSSTVIWVKMPKLPSSAKRTIRMYYGNSSASAASNGDSTFLIFDDFNGSSLNTTKWNTYTAASGGTFTESGGSLTITAKSAGRNSAIIRSAASISSPIITESSITSFTGWWPCIAILNSGTFSGYTLGYSDSAYSSGEMVLFNAISKGGTFGGGLFGAATGVGTPTGLWQLSWPSSNVQTGSWPSGSLSETFSSTTLASSVNIAAGTLFSGVSSMTMDWIRARTYASKDATSSIGSESANSGIATLAINRSYFCAGDTVSVPFTVFGNTTLNSGNVFTAQLSDSSGSFASPTNIGTLSSSTSGTIASTIPATAIGYHYHIRVVSSNPVLVGGNSPTNIFVPVRSSPSFSANVNAQCRTGNYFAFTNSTQNGAFYKWQFGDGSSSTSAAPFHTYGTDGSFTIEMYSTSIAGCVDSISQSVTVLPNAISSFSVNDSTQCFKPQNFVFTDKSSVSSGTISSWAWNFGDKNTSTAQNPSHSYTDSGSYVVQLTLTTNKGCRSGYSKNVRVNPLAGTAFGINKLKECFTGNSFNLSNASAATSNIAYKWVFGDGNTSTATSLVYSYASAGTYNIELYGTTPAGCTDSATEIVTVFPKVVAGFTANNATQCFKQQGFVFANSSVVSSGTLSQNWDFGDTSGISSVLSPVHAYKYPGTYLVKLVSTSDKGCTDSVSKSVTINPSPISFISSTGHDTVCEGSTVVFFTDLLPGYTYQWLQNGNKINSNGTKSSYYATAPGQYRSVVFNTYGCADTSKALAVLFNPLPLQPMVTQNGRQLSTSSATAYQWSMGGTDINGATSQTFYPGNNRDIYGVTVTDNNGCSNTSAPYLYDVSGIQNVPMASNPNIYPNPAHSFMYIDLTGHADEYMGLQIQDLSGRQVKVMNLAGQNGTVEISTDGIAKGFYIVKLAGKSGTYVQKIELN